MPWIRPTSIALALAAALGGGACASLAGLGEFGDQEQNAATTTTGGGGTGLGGGTGGVGGGTGGLDCTPTVPCDGDLVTNTGHCGACGHACEVSDSCLGSLCSPEEVVSGLVSPKLLVREGAHLFWVESGASIEVKQRDLATGATDQTVTSSNNASSVASWTASHS